MNETVKVYESISAVMAELSQEGISKGRKNAQQGYSFRGIDDVYNALSSILAKHKLVILPRVTHRECVERVSSNDKPIFYTILTVEFDLVSGEDGSKHTICTVGEAMDSADKSSNKAMSAAYKYACMQAFCIPTEGDNDADAHTPDVKARAAQPSPIVEAGAYLKQIGMDPKAFQAFKDDFPEGAWVDAAISGKKAGCADGKALYDFLAKGVAA